MGYRLWFGKFEYIDLSSSLIPAQLDMFGGEVRESARAITIDGRDEFNIEDIDSLTTLFRDEDEFRLWLISMGYFENDLDSHIVLTHKYKGLKEDYVVYNNSFLGKCAREVQKKKLNGALDSDIWLERTDEIISFARGITRYLRNVDTRNELLELGFDPGLYNGLLEYSGFQKDESFNMIVNGCLRYRDLRKLVVFEDKKRNLREMEFAQILESDIVDRELRCSPIKSSIIEDVYNTRDSLGEIDWERVFNTISTDDLFRCENFTDLQKVGYFKSYETRKSSGYDGR